MARRRIEIEVLVDPALAQRGFRQTGAAAKTFGRDVERAGRGVTAASLSFRGLGRSVAFASGAFLGGAGIVTAFKSTINAAEESQRVLAQTQNAVKRSGLAWAEYGKQIDKVTLKQSQMSGFDDERLSATFAKFVLKTKDVTRALRDNALAANIARSRNIELEAAAQLVMKAELGQSGALRRVGIDAAKGASSTQLLAQLNQKFAGSAEAYANTAAGAQDRFRVALENFQEVLGREALPTIAKYLNQGADWLNDTHNQEHALNSLKTAVGVVKDVVGALTPLVQEASGALQTFTKLVGGARKAIELLVIALSVRKLQQFAAGMRLVGTEAVATQGKIAGLRGALGGLPAFVGITIGLDIIANARTSANRPHHGFASWSGKGGWGKAVNDVFGLVGKDWKGPAPVTVTGGTGPTRETTPNAATARAAAETARLGIVDTGAGMSGSGTARVLKPTGMAALTRAQRNALRLSQAITPGEQLAALAEQRTIIAQQIASQTRTLSRVRGSKAREVADRIAELNNQDQAALSQIKSINETAAAAAAASAAKIKDDAEKKRQAMYDAVTYALGVAADRQGPLGGLEPLTLAGVNAAITKNEQEARKREIARAQAAQFRALGLSTTGDVLTPIVSTLRRQAAQVKKAIAGTPLDTDKNRNLLAQITSVLSGQNKKLGRVTQETRQKIKDLLDALNPKDQNAVHLITPRALNMTALTKGLGLTREQANAIRSRVVQARLGTGRVAVADGGITIHVHSRSDDPKAVARETISALQKEKKRRAVQVRGPHAGHPLGI